MANENSSLRMTVTLVVIAAVIALAMSYVNTLTAPVIAENAEKALNESLAIVLPAESYELVCEEPAVYKAVKGNEQIGVCVVNYAKGYGGDIKILSGISNDGSVNKIEILEMSETPGLGANAKNDSFKGQYEGKSGVLGVSKTNKSNTEILAISGATITSKAVTEPVNAAFETAKQWGVE